MPARAVGKGRGRRKDHNKQGNTRTGDIKLLSRSTQSRHKRQNGLRNRKEGRGKGSDPDEYGPYRISFKQSNSEAERKKGEVRLKKT